MALILFGSWFLYEGNPSGIFGVGAGLMMFRPATRDRGKSPLSVPLAFYLDVRVVPVLLSAIAFAAFGGVLLLEGGSRNLVAAVFALVAAGMGVRITRRLARHFAGIESLADDDRADPP